MRAFARSAIRSRTRHELSIKYLRSHDYIYPTSTVELAPACDAFHSGTKLFGPTPRRLSTLLDGRFRSIPSSVPDAVAHGEDTIYALSTAPGRAAIAIVRISGQACAEIYHALCPGRPLPKPRHAAVRTLHDPLSTPSPNSILDSNALILYFPSPNTVTGEDVLELHIHGGTAVVKAVLAAIPRCAQSLALATKPKHSIRYAEAGEFTRRAFMNDRLDLTQIEALADTLDAVTEQQRRFSVRGTSGGLAKRYESWRQQLLYARGELEALIDFSEDQHFDEPPAELASFVAVQVEDLRKQIQAQSTNAVRGELLRNGISIALLGAPNAVGREAAIVSEEEGTTRDVVEAGIDLGGWYCRLGDTAGLRSKCDAPNQEEMIGKVEEEGMKRAMQKVMEADVVVAVLSVELNQTDGHPFVKIVPDVLETAAKLRKENNNVVVVVNKSDRIRHEASSAIPQAWISQIQQFIPDLDSSHIFNVSCKDAEYSSSDNSDGGRIQFFLNGLTEKFKEITSPVIPDGHESGVDPSDWEESLGATQRQRLLLDECLTHLDVFLAEITSQSGAVDNSDEGDVDIVVAAESLRAAAECLAKITGKGEAGDVEEVLGVVFEKSVILRSFNGNPVTNLCLDV
ncbi:MAG: mitochondrial splicing system protein [Pycnora praestabilis]|nr:MAG: mitochondrial splicing system protein [Pycnora praestabilis]